MSDRTLVNSKHAKTPLENGLLQACCLTLTKKQTTLFVGFVPRT
jgi:hypothetical protein